MNETCRFQNTQYFTRVERLAHAPRDRRHARCSHRSDLSVMSEYYLGVQQDHKAMGVRRVPPIKAQSVSFSFPPGMTLRATRTSRSQMRLSAERALAEKRMLKKQNDELRNALSGLVLRGGMTGIGGGMLPGSLASRNAGSGELQKLREDIVTAQSQSAGLSDIQTRIRSIVAELTSLDTQQALYRNDVMRQIKVLKDELASRSSRLATQAQRIRTPQDRATITQMRANLAMQRDQAVSRIMADASTYKSGVAQRRTNLQASLASSTTELESAQRASQNLVALQRRATELSKIIEPPAITRSRVRRRVPVRRQRPSPPRPSRPSPSRTPRTSARPRTRTPPRPPLRPRTRRAK